MAPQWYIFTGASASLLPAFPTILYQSGPFQSLRRIQAKGCIQKTKWIFLMALAIKCRPPAPLPLMALISIHLFTPLFFLLQLNLTYVKRIIHLVSNKNITFEASYNWVKIDIRWLLRSPTAVFSHVHSHLIYYIHNKKLKLCAKRVLAVRE